MELKTVLVVALGCISLGQAFKQEMWFYDAQGNGLYFGESTPDLYRYSTILLDVTRICSYGRWQSFEKANYGGYADYWGTEDTTDLICRNNVDASLFKSIRHYGASDTTTDALSLYSESGLDGYELYITERAHTGINRTIHTLAATGPSAWMLFSGQELDGTSGCWEPRDEIEEHVRSTYPVSVGVRTIGSVYKGCIATEIQAYRDKHFPK